MNKLNELFDYDNGVIKTMKSINPEKTETIFGVLTDEDISVLDNEIFSRYGNRSLSAISSITYNQLLDSGLTREMLCRHLFVIRLNSWLKIKADLSIEYDTVSNFDRKNTITETINGTSGQTELNKQNSNTFGFDSDTASPDSNTEENNTVSGTSDSTRTTINETTGIINGVVASDLIQKNILFIKNNSFLDIVLDNIKNDLTSGVYDD